MQRVQRSNLNNAISSTLVGKEKNDPVRATTKQFIRGMNDVLPAYREVKFSQETSLAKISESLAKLPFDELSQISAMKTRVGIQSIEEAESLICDILHATLRPALAKFFISCLQNPSLPPAKGKHPGNRKGKPTRPNNKFERVAAPCLSLDGQLKQFDERIQECDKEIQKLTEMISKIEELKTAKKGLIAAKESFLASVRPNDWHSDTN